MMIFKNVEKKYVDEALEIAIEEYQEECLKCPDLIKINFEEELRNLLVDLFERQLGKVAIKNEKVIGYLAFWGPWEGFHGKVKGVFSPLGGSGFRGENRSMLASRLFQEVSQGLIQENVCSYAVSRYAHDEEVGESFVFNGFGIRCSDAIMKLSDRKVHESNTSSIRCIELIGESKREIDDLARGLTSHLCSSPIFFPTDLTHYDRCIKNEGIRVVVAKERDRVIGYMALDTEAETFVSNNKDMYNICGAFVKEQYRGQNVSEQLLEYVCQIAEQEGKNYLGVDYETLNPTALRFWRKNFSNYTYSYIRRIDERVIGYNVYMENYYNTL